MLALVFCLFAVAVILTYLTKEAREHQRQNEIHRNNDKCYMDNLNDLKQQAHELKKAKASQEDTKKG